MPHITFRKYNFNFKLILQKKYSFTCFLFWEILLGDSGELERVGWSSADSGELKPEARRAAVAFLTPALDLLPVNPVCIGTLGVLTTRDDKDLSFLFAGSAIEGTTSDALTFFLLKGNIFPRISCRLWSGLHKVNRGAWECKLIKTEYVFFFTKTKYPLQHILQIHNMP